VSKASEAPTVELLLGIGKHMHCDQKFKKEKLKLKLKPKKKGEGVGHNNTGVLHCTKDSRVHACCFNRS